MKLPKHELNKYHIGLQECIRTRKEWLHYYQIKMRWKKLKKEAKMNEQKLTNYKFISNYFDKNI